LKTHVHGVIVPLITPFKQDLSIDYNALEWLLGRLVEAGVHGVFPSSSTGEFVHLDSGEIERLNAFVVEKTGSKVEVYAGVTSNSTEQALKLAGAARDAGADAVVVAPPYYYRPDPETMFRHFSNIAEKADIPVILYNNTGITGISMPIDVILRLIEEHDSVVGVKVTYDSFTYLARLVDEAKARRPGFSVLTGSAYLSLPCLMIGGDGVVAALANAYPRILVRLYDSWSKRNLAEASELYSKILELSRLYTLPGHLGANIKEILYMAGTPVKPFSRPPATPTSDKVLGEFLSHHPIEL